MCMTANEEASCRLNATVAALSRRVDAIEARLDAVESTTRDGFATVNSNIETLSQQITNMDKRMVEEKQKWGDTLRGIVKWTVRAILAVVTYAAGVNLTKDLIPGLFN